MDTLHILYISRTTLLISSEHWNILTNPDLYTRRPLTKKVLATSVFKQLDKVNMVILTCGKKRCIDIDSFKFIKASTPVVTPEGLSPCIQRLLPNPIIKLSPWATHDFHNNLKITACGTDKAASSYIIAWKNHTIYFCTDYQHWQLLQDISTSRAMDVAIIAIRSPALPTIKRYLSPQKIMDTLSSINAKHVIPLLLSSSIKWNLPFLKSMTLNEFKSVAESKITGKMHFIKAGQSIKLLL